MGRSAADRRNGDAPAAVGAEMTTATINSKCRQHTRRRLPAYGRKVIALRESGQAPTVAVLVADGWKPIANVEEYAPWVVIVPDDEEPERLDFGFLSGLFALLVGLLRCRRCGHKLVVHYTGSHHDVLRYQCRRGWLDNGEPRCIGFAGLVVDQAITREILRVVQPAAIEAAVMAHEEQARKVDEVLAALQRDLEAAQYSARRRH